MHLGPIGCHIPRRTQLTVGAVPPKCSNNTYIIPIGEPAVRTRKAVAGKVHLQSVPFVRRGPAKLPPGRYPSPVGMPRIVAPPPPAGPPGVDFNINSRRAGPTAVPFRVSSKGSNGLTGKILSERL